ncbi:riboflavin kinase [Mycoplasma putrefaciens]|uniref:riboflavin kinase n=1 Tax=Mycoplasma putrefaciens (strain ATCC 15718 / NCTC 10155 / C30 KS-1 / KS-1) TaxID=743965 RepID=A0A7U4E9R6_MYCPK|nr:riboflavin kinase [Mycoplasma putrefaciens]AEM68819.1 riboflavin kinase/FAD synthetase [Mycoplasma putrefaciens KS1]
MNNQKTAIFTDFKYLTKRFLCSFTKANLVVFGYCYADDDFDYLCSNYQISEFKKQGFKIIELLNDDFLELINQYNISNVYSLKSFSQLDKLVKLCTNTIIKDDTDLIKQAKQLLVDADIKEFKKITGFNYSFSGIVTLCNQLGRTINFPTANILTNSTFVVKNGVYLVKVVIDHQQVRYGMGDSWVNRNNLMVFEANIFDFNKDIYSKHISFELLEYIRENQKINSLDQLVELIENDKKTCLNLLKESYE